MKAPKDLYVLWEEYIAGLEGNKPAWLFTPKERGRVKSIYCKRNVFWQKVSEHIRAGVRSFNVIDQIYHVYGQSLPVSRILQQMTRDKANGGHSDLAVGKI